MSQSYKTFDTRITNILNIVPEMRSNKKAAGCSTSSADQSRCPGYGWRPTIPDVPSIQDPTD